jgi:hypothetical protein
MIVWNERDTQATSFMAAYERLIQRHAPHYAVVDYRHVYQAGLGLMQGSDIYFNCQYGNPY